MRESVSACGRAYTEASTSDRGRVTRSPAPRRSCGTSAVGTPRSWPAFWNGSRLGVGEKCLAEPASDHVRDRPKPRPGHVADASVAGQVRVRPGAYRLRGVDRQTGTPATVGGVLE